MQNHALPLGGIGAGFLLLNERGHFYNHIPTTDQPGKCLHNSFPCVRIQTSSGKRYYRALCENGADDQSLKKHPGQPEFLGPGQYQVQIQYPEASFQLCDKEAPVDITWTWFNPVVPYDQVAAAMPVVLLGVRVENTGPEPVNAAVMLSFDNILSMQSDLPNPRYCLIHPIRNIQEEEVAQSFGKNVFRGTLADVSTDMLQTYGFNALLFGERRKTDETEPHFHCCLAAQEHHAAKIFVTNCDLKKNGELQRVRRTFFNHGKLPPVKPLAASQLAAIASGLRLAPGESHRFEFAFSWYLPGTYGEKRHVSVSYSSSFKSAQEVAAHGLKHLSYLFIAVEKWHRQLADLNLPKAFNRALVDCTRSLTTHTRHRPGGGFGFAALGSQPDNGGAQWDFLPAMALLAFAPHFHTAAVTSNLNSIQAAMESGDHEESHEFLCKAASLILSAYADAVFLGHRARLADWYPVMQRIVETVTHKDMNDYASTSGLLARFSLRGMGLWAVALTALAKIAHDKKEEHVCARYQKTASILLARYQSELLEPFHLTKRTAAGAEQEMREPSDLEFLGLTGACSYALLNMETPPALAKILTIIAEKCEAWGGGALSGPGAFRVQLFETLLQVMHTRGGIFGLGEVESSVVALAERYEQLVRQASAAKTTPPLDVLSIWAVFQALVGFYYDALQQVVVLRPLIEADATIRLPIFCPMSLGKITTKLEDGDEKLVSIRFSVQIPLMVRALVLRLPAGTVPENIVCISDTETLAAEQVVQTEAHFTRVAIKFKTPLKLASTVTVRLYCGQYGRK